MFLSRRSFFRRSAVGFGAAAISGCATPPNYGNDGRCAATSGTAAGDPADLDGARPGPGSIQVPVTGLPPKDEAMYASSMNRDEPYTLGPDSLVKANVPKGTITRHVHVSKVIYPGVERDYWLYVPAQYSLEKPAALMVFNDGSNYLDAASGGSTMADVRAHDVFDNLIHQKEMPVTIGLFVNPGRPGPALPVYGLDMGNRSLEYDALGDRYARYLIEELMSEALGHYRITDDPEGRAICGYSSGGIGAFTVAWEQSGHFRKVVGHSASFIDIRGGHNYPSMIRKLEKRPLRVWLQTGARDLDGVFGDIRLANLQIAGALAYRDYDYQLVVGEGGHSLLHPGQVFPDTMRWLWRDYR